MSNSNLQPCPFCGSNNLAQNGSMAIIFCRDCWASGPSKESSQEYLKGTGTDFILDLEGDKRLKAIEAAWNHRNTCQPGDFNHIELALPEEYLADAWKQQADEFNQWDSLESSEQLAWAQSRAVAVDRNRRANPSAPEPVEGPTLKEVSEWICKEDPDPGAFGYQHHDVMRIILAALARWGRPAAPPVAEVPGQDAAPARDLVKRVGSALAQIEPEQDGFTSEDKSARVAMREVTAWLDQRGQHGCSLWLREEADR